jgi:hypothetical protein
LFLCGKFRQNCHHGIYSAVQPVDFIPVRNFSKFIKCFEVVNKRGLFKNDSEKYILVELPKNKKL